MKKIFLILFAVTVCKVSVAQKYKTAIIAFYNCENFYDTIDNPLVNDDDFTPRGDKNYNSIIYWNKVEHLANVLSQIGTDVNPDGPAIIGVAEIENDTVLNDLVVHPLLKNRNYKIVHYDSKDIRGVDVALLYNPKYFTVETSKKLFVRLPQGAKEAVFTRDILYVCGKLDGEVMHILVNHWPSKRGGEERSAPGREAAAEVDKNFIDSINRVDINAKIIVMGDLNDDPVSSAVTKVLNAKGKIESVKPGDLYNPWVDLYKKGIGTLAYDDAWGLFDQILISYPWLNKQQTGFFYYRQFIFSKSFMIENVGRFKGYPMRTWDGNNYRGGYSDHFPTYLVMSKKQTMDNAGK